MPPRPIRGSLSKKRTKGSNYKRNLYCAVAVVVGLFTVVGIFLYFQVLQSFSYAITNSRAKKEQQQQQQHSSLASESKHDTNNNNNLFRRTRKKKKGEDRLAVGGTDHHHHHHKKKKNVRSGEGVEDQDGLYGRLAEQEVAPLAGNEGAKKKEEQQQRPPAGDGDNKKKETLVITFTDTKEIIRIVLRPDLSKESVDYIHDIIKEGCKRCNLYRAEKPGILQGMIVNKKVSSPANRGKCPPGFETVPNDCPEYDEKCGCHGPVMNKGYVAWAAGRTGPDFFIDNYERPAKWWGTQHTVWGTVEDDTSFNVINQVWSLPATKDDGLTYLDKPIQFRMEIL